MNTYPHWFDCTTWGSKRWRTAITRKSLSVPMRLAVERGIITPEKHVLDFGCGKNFDVRYLNLKGYKTSAFDPYYWNYPENVKPSPVISANFVLNVIETKEERAEVFKYLWDLTESTLILAVRTGADGYGWTQLGTFQQYYTQKTWYAYIAKTLGVVRVEYPASGIAFIHRK